MKKKYLFLFILVVLLSLNPNHLFAKNKIRFEKVDIGSNSSIGAGFIQDRDGFFWIGSQPGLNKWNGSDNIIYMSSASGLTDNTVTAIIEDKIGRIWVGTMDGLNAYDKATNQFTQFKYAPNNLNSLSHESIGMINHFQSMTEDQNGYLWIATQNGLNRFNPENKQFIHFMHDPENSNSISSNIINAIFEDSSGTLWIGTKDGLNKLNKNSGSFIRYKYNAENLNSLSHNEVYSIGEDDKGNLWIGTEMGLNKLNRNSDSFIRFYSDTGPHRIIEDNKVTSINKDKKGRLWLCHYTKGSVTLLYPKTNTSQYFIHDSDAPDNLPTNDVKYVYEDRQGTIWFVSTTGGNIYKYDPNGQKFVTYKHDSKNTKSINGNSVLPIYEDKNGIVWIGTDKNKLNKFDKKTGKFTYIPIEGYYPYAFFEDNQGVFWIGETTGRLSIFDRTTQTYIKSYEGFSSSFITHIAQDSMDSSILWLTTHKDGLVKFNVKTEKTTHYRHQDKNKHSLSNNSVWGFWQEGDTLWLGTWGGGLNKFSKKDETFIVYKHDPKDPGSVSSNVCGNILVTSKGRLFVSTLGGGLNEFIRKDETFEYFNTTNGLFPSDNLEGLLEDENGNLWIASSTEEVIKFNTKTKGYKAYGPGDGIEIGGPWFVANHKSPDGQMWFGGPKGVTAFYPEKIKNNVFKPPVYITSLTQGGEPIETDKSLEKLSEIMVSWRKPFFEFKAAALNYTRPQHNRYKYKLEGWDSEWFNSGHLRNGRYSNLKGGDYILRIAASNNDGVWCAIEQEVALKVKVSSPFWQTRSFKSFVLGFIGLVILSIFYYLKRLNAEIVERKRVEISLAAEKERLAVTLKSIGDGVITTDTKGNIIFLNNKAEKLTGWFQKQAFKQPIEKVFNIINEHTRIACENPVKKVLESGMIVGLANHTVLITKEKKERIIADSGAPIIDSENKIIGVVLVFRDITDRKLAEKRQADLEIQLQQAQKMETIGTLAGGIAHDFNNILFPIVGHAEMLLEDFSEDESTSESLHEIYISSLRAKDLVNQILTFSRQEKSELKLMRMQPVIKEALKLCRSTIPTTIDINQDIQTDVGIIKADPTQIHQIIMNLTTNAYHAMEDTGGELTVTLKEVKLGENDLINPDMRSGLFACLTVSDTGLGMDANLKNKIFNPFFTTKEKGKGTGMGLSVVHGIVTGLHGGIQIITKPKDGTKFLIYIPIRKRSYEKKNQLDKEIQSGNEHVLLVDDEESIINMEKKMLERLGYKVTVQMDSVKALEVFQNNPDFDLVVTDFAMPNMPGDKFASKLLEIKPDTPIILCTGFSEKMTPDLAKEIGIKGILLKPIIKKDLAKKIREALDS